METNGGEQGLIVLWIGRSDVESMQNNDGYVGRVEIVDLQNLMKASDEKTRGSLRTVISFSNNILRFLTYNGCLVMS